MSATHEPLNSKSSENESTASDPEVQTGSSLAAKPSPSAPGILRSILFVILGGFMFGTGLQKAGVYRAEVIRAQFLFENQAMLLVCGVNNCSSPGA